MSARSSELAQLLEGSLDPRQNKAGEFVSRSNKGNDLTHNHTAELKIKQQERQAGFSVQLLNITASESFPYNTRLASALFFKNFIKRNWVNVEGRYKLPPDEVSAIKTELVGLMIRVPSGIQTQLGEAISVIADSDFWERWDTLVDDLVSRLTSDNTITNIGVLQVAHSIFSRWRPLFRSDDLFTEINHVLSKFAAPFLSLWQNLDAVIDSNTNNRTALRSAFSELDLILKLFYDLSCQDLAPQFEDNIGSIASLLLKYLVFENELLQTDNETESGPLENTKADIFEVLTLYVSKYYDSFGPHVNDFVNSSWTLLTTVGLEPKNDILISKALAFLTSICRINEQVQTFNDQNVLTQVVEKVIIPNLSLRESDIEMFEDEPIEFIRRDLEGADSETRRRAATDFVRSLVDKFPDSVTGVVTRYIQKSLAEYSANPESNWKAKDTAVYLFCAIAARGVATASQGVTKVNDLVNIGEFFSNNLASDLTSSGVEPLLKVDAIKFLYTFRSLITQDQWQQVMPMMVNHLADSNYVVYTYAAIAVERVLYLTNDAGKPIIEASQIVPLSKDLLNHLFSLIEKDKAAQKVQENEFLMRCVMRVLIVMKDGVAPITEEVLRHLIEITNIIAPNPSNPRFYYYHFESLGALVRFCPPALSAQVSQALFSPFLNILQADIEEFTPYVFQLFAAALEAEPTQPLPEIYHALVGPVLAPPIWEQRGNIPALARMLRAIIPRYAQPLVQGGQIASVLGLFQKLVSTKTFENYGFELLETVIEFVPPTALEQYWTDLLNIMLTRLSSGGNVQSFQTRFIRFYHFFASRDDKGLGTDYFIAQMNRVQDGVFRQVYLSIILPKTQELARPLDRKIAAISFTKLLADSERFIDTYPKGWPLSCNALLKLLETPPVIAAAADNIADHDVDDMGFGVGFTQLQTVKPPTRDSFADITDLRKWVGQYLRAADGRHNDRIGKLVNEGLSPVAKAVLMSYMQM